MDRDTEDRFRQWAAARAGRLHRVAYLLCGDWHTAEDMVQEALARAALHWHRVERAGQPDAYVRQILVNEVRGRWRRRSNREQPVRDPEAGTVSDRSDSVAAQDEIVGALRRLPAGQRAAIVLRYFEDLSEVDTASAMGCSVGTVKSQTHRGLAALRRHLSVEVTS